MVQYSISLPGVTDSGTVASGSFANALAQLSASVWYKTTQAAFPHVLDKSSDFTADGGWQVNLNNAGKAYVNIRQPLNAGQYQAISTTASNDGAWHNFIFTFDSVNGFVFYLDGNSQSFSVSGTNPGTNYSNTLTFGVGNIAADPNPALSGSMASVRVWNSILTSSDASTVAAGGTVATSLIGDWEFTEGSGLTAADSSGGGNTLTFTAVNWSTDMPIQFSLVPQRMLTGMGR